MERQLADAALAIAKARWKFDEKVAQDEQALCQLQATQAEQLAALQKVWYEASTAAAVKASAAATAAAAAQRRADAPLRHVAAATAAEAATALRNASAACTGALEACTTEADSYAPAVARARATLDAEERQRDAALAARQRVEEGMAAVTGALARAEGMTCEVDALVNERDAARAAAALLQAELLHAREEHASKLATTRCEQAAQTDAMLREATARTAALAASVGRADVQTGWRRSSAERARRNGQHWQP